MENLIKTMESTNIQDMVSATKNMPNMEATPDSEDQALSEYTALTLSVKRAIRNTLKIMDGKYGGGFYIKYIMDMGTCYSWLNLIIVYPDGNYKSVILYKNYFREADIEGSNGVYTPPKNNGPKKTYTKVYWDGNEKLERYTSLEQYEIPQMPIPARGIWQRIYENSSKIPVVKMNQTATLDQLVAELREWAKEASNGENQGFMDDANRSYVDTEEFRKIVENNGWSVSRARLELDMQGLLEKDSNTKGYQKTKRVGTTTRRFYVIRKDTDMEDIPPKSLENTKYDVGGIRK